VVRGRLREPAAIPKVVESRNALERQDATADALAECGSPHDGTRLSAQRDNTSSLG